MTVLGLNWKIKDLSVRPGFVAVASRVLNAVFGIVTILFITYKFSSKMQGYYYTFNSVIQLQVFFDAGIAFVLTQTASRYIGKYKDLTDNGILVSDISISALFYSALRFYSISALLFFISVTVGGYFFFQFHDDGRTVWKVAWIIVSFATSLNLLSLPFTALAEGLGMVLSVARLRLLQALLIPLVLWVALLSGYGLLSMGFASLSMFAVSLVWIYKNRLVFLNYSVIFRSRRVRLDEENDIRSFQWKTSVSWLSGYFVYQIYNPILFSTIGPEDAGKVGLIMSIVISISFLISAYINTKIPKLGALAAGKMQSEYEFLRLQIIKNTLILSLVLYISFVVVVYIVEKTQMPLSHRLIPIYSVILSAIWGFLNVIYNLRMTFMRSFGKDSVFHIIFTLFLTCGLFSIPAAQYFGVNGLLSIYVVTMFLLNYIIRNQERKTDHWKQI